VAVQYGTLPRGLPESLKGPGFEAQRVGYRQAPLGPADLRGNAFQVTVRDLSQAEAAALGSALTSLKECGLPNYFDAQRFGSYAPGWGFIGKAILRRDAEGALRAYLARPFVGDPAGVRRFKEQSAALWPDWRAIMAVAPRPSNYRSVLTYLCDHPEDHRKALNLIPARLLALYLAAYQSHVWNQIAAACLCEMHTSSGDASVRAASVRVAEHDLPVYSPPSWEELERLRAVGIPLPHHRAVYRPEALAGIAARVLGDEGLTLDDFKARILARAYLPRQQRALWVTPEEMGVEGPAPDAHFAGRCSLRVAFSLPGGCYATLVVRVAAALAGAQEARG
jgi:tRNA pseudouridine13 synthase